MVDKIILLKLFSWKEVFFHSLDLLYISKDKKKQENHQFMMRSEHMKRFLFFTMYENAIQNIWVFRKREQEKKDQVLETKTT